MNNWFTANVTVIKVYFSFNKNATKLVKMQGRTCFLVLFVDDETNSSTNIVTNY